MIKGMTGVVLAGGRGSRFGSDKALAAWKGGTLLQAVVSNLLTVLPEVLVVSKDQARPALGPRVRRINDREARRHPLVGLQAGLAACATPWAFVCACDMPLIRPELIRRLAALRLEAEAVVPVWRGHPQPFCAAYARGSLAALEMSLERPGSVLEFVRRLRVRWVVAEETAADDPEGQSFMDIDDPAAYREALGCAS